MLCNTVHFIGINLWRSGDSRADEEFHQDDNDGQEGEPSPYQPLQRVKAPIHGLEPPVHGAEPHIHEAKGLLDQHALMFNRLCHLPIGNPCVRAKQRFQAPRGIYLPKL